MRHSKKIFTWLTIFFLTANIVSADEKFPGKIDVCVSCHGPLGISIFDLWPNLAGQKRVYLVKQLKAFRDGSRYDPWMTPMAVPLSDADIEELAKFYSGL